MKKFRPKVSTAPSSGSREEVGVFAIRWFDKGTERVYVDARGSYMELHVEIVIASNCTATLSGGSDAV